MLNYDFSDPTEDLINEALRVIQSDYDEVLGVADNYLHGRFADPYSPKGLTGEQRAMMRKAKLNWCEIPVEAATQVLLVDGFRPGEQQVAGPDGILEENPPEWDLWQRSNLDAKQSMVHRSAVAYGQAFVVSELDDLERGRAKARVLSALRTVCLYEDVLSDDNALLALSVMRWPGERSLSGEYRPGRAVAWDRYKRYDIQLGSTGPWIVEESLHGGNGHCPVTRFVAKMDDEGRVVGSVLPLKNWQDIYNQMVFNLLIDQSHSAHRILWATGLQPQEVVDADGRPGLLSEGKTLYQRISAGPGDFLVNDDPNGKFGALAGGDMSGYISSLDMAVKAFSAMSQTPPNFLLGQMANLSADALNAAEKSFRNKIGLYRSQFGEAWERVLRIGMILEGREPRERWEHNEVLWRDIGSSALSQVADALSKLRDIEVPAKGLWEMVPGVSPAQLARWRDLDADDRLGTDLSGSVRDYEEMSKDGNPFSAQGAEVTGG